VSPDLETAAQLFSQGLQLHLEKNWSAAEELYRQALALVPGRPSVIFNLGRLMLDQRRYREAEVFFAQSVRLAADDHEACYNLGVSQARQDRFEEALAQFDRAIALKPDFAEAHADRGAALAGLGEFESALESQARSVELAPGVGELQVRFARCAAVAPFRREGIRPERLEGAVRACLAGSNVDYRDFGVVASILLDRKFAGIKLRLERHGFDIAALHAQSPDDLRAFCGDPLLLSFLEKIVVTDGADEAFYTGVRHGLLRPVVRGEGGGAPTGLIEPLVWALACQCFLNEYVWGVTDEETALVAQLASRSAAALATSTATGLELGLLGCYTPLQEVPGIVEWCDSRPGNAGSGLDRLLERQVLEPRAEAGIAVRLKRAGRIENPVSLAVKAQYEENPYPRWLTLCESPPAPYVEQIAACIAPHSPALEATAEHPRVLIAGCGTGREALSYAQAFAKARCTAIDLSGASLAYAERKAGELGIRNIEFIQGDILDLDERESFDVVSCAGVLHHMAEPERGLQRVLRALKPRGYLKLALYSELARRDVVLIRELIAEHRLEPTARGIRACRELIRKDVSGRFHALIAQDNDFYTTSMVRDLLFHVQEHRYTIPQLRAMLARHDLEFLGFQTANPAIKRLYKATYPGDPNMLDLDNWDALECSNPRLFRSMYQFWTRTR